MAWQNSDYKIFRQGLGLPPPLPPAPSASLVSSLGIAGQSSLERCMTCHSSSCMISQPEPMDCPICMKAPCPSSLLAFQHLGAASSGCASRAVWDRHHSFAPSGEDFVLGSHADASLPKPAMMMGMAPSCGQSPWIVMCRAGMPNSAEPQPISVLLCFQGQAGGLAHDMTEQASSGSRSRHAIIPRSLSTYPSLTCRSVSCRKPITSW